jgi:alpha-galactosidase
MNPMRSRVNLYLCGAFALLFFLAAGGQLAFSQAAAVSLQGLAPTPPMGWASWNHFFCDYNDQTIRDQADALVSSGMRDLGYKYVLIQECIAPKRNADGSLVVDAKRFPHGMKALVDYVHSRGLKAGIYTDIGEHTCSSNPRYEGSYKHEEQDASTFAAWGMDFVEMDYCNKPQGVTGKEIYERMSAAIRKTGRPMVFYLCCWGNEKPWTWAQGTAQLWRTEGDISLDKNHVDWPSVVRNFRSNARHAVFSAPNSWNDPDMMEVGNPGISLVEAQSHFSMWAISAAPLWAGNDLTSMPAAIYDIYTNAEAIAIDQDPLGAGGQKVKEYEDGIEVWMKPLGSVGSGVDAVMLLNLTAAPQEIGVQWSDLGLEGKVAVRDLWAHKDLGELSDGYKTQIPSHGSVLLKVSGAFSWTKGASYEAEWPGNLRGGDAELVSCPECSLGYAVRLSGAKNNTGGSSLAFTHIGVPQTGTYWLSLARANGAAGGKTAQIKVNEGRFFPIELKGGPAEATKVPVQLKKGDNSVVLRFRGEGSVDIDRLTVSR